MPDKKNVMSISVQGDALTLGDLQSLVVRARSAGFLWSSAVDSTYQEVQVIGNIPDDRNGVPK